MLEPDDGGVPEPDGGVPVGARAAAHVGAVLGRAGARAGGGAEEPELVLPEPELPEPVLPVLELDDGVVVDELLVELVPELPVVVDVVAALATSAPPARRPEVSAPRPGRCEGGSALVVFLSSRVERRPVRAGTADGAPRT